MKRFKKGGMELFGNFFSLCSSGYLLFWLIELQINGDAFYLKDMAIPVVFYLIGHVIAFVGRHMHENEMFQKRSRMRKFG